MASGHLRMGSLTLCTGLLLCMVGVIDAQSSVPIISNYSALNDRYFEELFPVGSVVGTIEATDPDGTGLFYYLIGDGGEYFSIGLRTGIITLKKELDFETDFEIKSTIRVVDESGQATSVDVKVFVNDENDNEPFFDDYGIFEEISESESVGFTVARIDVEDLDTKNDIISVVCNSSTLLFADACDKFAVQMSRESNKYWEGYIVLQKKLDFEERISYAILVTAYDGKYYESNEIHIEVVDVNDSPPQFVIAGPSIINEELPIGTVFQTVLAEDTDITEPSQIRYELINENIDRFQINPVTGALSNRVRLDYDNVAFPKNIPFELIIKARELQPDNITLGDGPLTTATVRIKVTVLDINDNTPTFDSNTYEARIDENIVSGANIPGLQMTVTDIDSGTFNSFDLVSLNHTDVFQIIPTEDASSASVTLFVVNSRRIDYEAGPRQYIVQVEARQNKVPNPVRTGTATVTINVDDVNDITPTFPAASYTRTVSELARGGSLIIDLNATDPEAGPFGTAGIRYQLYGNIPPHFTLDPISGVVRVADCATPGEVPCIDYERKQSYTLTVSATDNNGAADGRTRSVQLIIDVEDENDVRPAIEAIYERYILENERVTINPLRIDAVDPDTVGGPLTYSVQGDSTGLWQVTTQTDPTTGQLYGNITAIRPIVYQDAPNQQDGQFRFAVIVRDRQYQTTADVIINVLDINNNAPVFSPNEFVESIPENTLGEVSIIQVTATDGDAPTTGNGLLDITIGSGGRGKFYARPTQQQGNSFVADIYTTREATFNYEADSEYNMELVVRDRGTPESKVGTGRLTVYILDINNRNPIIRPSFASITVSENTPVGRSIHQVSASDRDDNNDLRYSFQADTATDGNGARVNVNNYDYRDLFRMDDITGEVFVNSALDRDRAASITFNLLVRDVAANPVQSGTGILLIHITEYNDQPPRFNSSQYNIVITEELNINSFIQNLYCTDEDDKIESYSLNQDQPRRPNFFSFYSTSGAMLIENRIDYDPPGNIETIQLTAYCADTGTPQLSASTKVTVTVLNINDNYPVFEQPLYRTEIPEGSAGGPLNVNIQASDLDRGDYGVVRYTLLDTNGPYDQFFSIDEITNCCIIQGNSALEKESDISPRQCGDSSDKCGSSSGNGGGGGSDDGSSSGKAVMVVVEEVMIEEEEEVVVMLKEEEVMMEEEVVMEKEEVMDKEEKQEAVRGEITIANNASFDREETGFFGLQVEAYDSPNNAAVRLRTSVPVYITIKDINDNCPIFTQRNGYSGTVPESAEPDTSIIDLIASDRDEGPNAQIVFAIKPGSGNPADTATLFTIGRTNGRILVRGQLRRRAGFYTFNVTATDLNGDNSTGQACSAEVPVTLEVKESLNSAPEWVRPPRRDFVIYVLESQYEGMLVYSAKAVDQNVGENGVVDYFFMDGDQLTHRTADFRINRVTGVIRAEVEFDREEQDTYYLTLLAKDRGNPASSSETTLTIVILDVDDNDPIFPMKDGRVTPLNLPEAGIQITNLGSSSPNGYLGKCLATDADSDHANNRIFYDLLATEDVRNYIEVDRQTCNVTLKRPVDEDVYPTLEFDIMAYNEKNDDTVRRYRTKRAVNPSIQHVIVTIPDVNDNPPVFTSNLYFGCISIDAPYRKTILEVSATDVDAGDDTRIRYSLEPSSQAQGFGIDPVVGSLYNTKSFRNAQRSYELDVLATDTLNTPARAKAMVFVTSPSNVVKLKVNRALTDVQPFSEQLVNTLEGTSNADIAFACIDNMRNHIDDDGDEVLTATDVFVTAVRRSGSNYEIYPADALVTMINDDREDDDSPFNAIYITEVEVEGDDDGFTLEEDAVLAILIISILLIFLALLLFCIACYCIKKK
ncbi:cadherin-87a [Plakobranchus ocellatus]|uniref:Cadherin-87a n=1 Tax=Plakobranchus ocellatus TaxID=259542 RepID=A0AAV4A7Q3_9GAST|nr:cadherin-87a [Plakobranchus ocellatus]